MPQSWSELQPDTMMGYQGEGEKRVMAPTPCSPGDPAMSPSILHSLLPPLGRPPPRGSPLTASPLSPLLPLLPGAPTSPCRGNRVRADPGPRPTGLPSLSLTRTSHLVAILTGRPYSSWGSREPQGPWDPIFASGAGGAAVALVGEQGPG